MKQNISREHATSIYSIGTFFIMLKLLVGFSNLINIPGILDVFFSGMYLICMGYLIFMQVIATKKVIAFGLFTVCLLFSYMRSPSFYLVISLFSIWALNNVDLKIVLKRHLILTASFLLLHIVVYFMFLAVSPGSIAYVYRNGVKRHTFFMSHPNTFSMFVTWCFMEYIYLYYEKMDFIRIVFLFCAGIFVKIFADSNTAMIVSVLVMLLIFAERYQIKRVRRFTAFFSKYGFGIFSVFFNLIIVLYTKLSGVSLMAFNMLDSFFTGRLMYGAFIYNVNGWTMLGKRVNLGGKIFWLGKWFDGVVCDNAYILWFICYGTFYLVVLTLAFWKISRKTTTLEKIMIVAYIVYGSMETYILNSFFCFPMLFIGKYLFDGEEEKNLELEILHSDSGIQC